MNKKRLVIILAVAIATMTAITISTSESYSFGGFKNLLKKPKAEQSETQATDNQQPAAAEQPQSASSEPVQYENKRFKYTFTYPGNWTLTDTDPKKSTVSVQDMGGLKGVFIASSTWMSDDFPVEPAFQALIKKAKDRKQHGELDDYYVKKITVKKNGKDVDIVKGVVVIESDIDPDMKRMQWEAYGGGNYYNFTTSTTAANFPGYKDKFKDMIDSVEFDFSGN